MKPVKNILILGGYGRTGFEIAKLLLKHSSCDIQLAGRDPIRAVRSARELNSGCFEERVKGIEVNAALKTQLVRLFENVDLVINAIPIMRSGGKIAQAALEAGIHYLDLGNGGVERDAFYQLEHKVREAGLTFIIEAGIVSGVPSVIARYLTGQFDSTDYVAENGKNDTKPGKWFTAWFPRGNKRKLKSPPAVSSVSVSGTGISGGRGKKLMLTVGHKDASLAAATSALPCVLGLFDGSINRPGIHLMGQVLDPDRYLENLWDLGMTVSLQTYTEPMQMESRSGEMSLVRWDELPVF